MLLDSTIIFREGGGTSDLLKSQSTAARAVQNLLQFPQADLVSHPKLQSLDALNII